MNKLLSIIVPCYNEEEVLPIFMEAVTKVRDGLRNLPDAPCDTELLFVDDGSSDQSLDILKSFHRADSTVRYISFPVISEKKLPSWPVLKTSKGIMQYLWMPICSTRRNCLLRCIRN